MRMSFPLLSASLLALVLAFGCASAPMATPERDTAAKTFAPVPDKAVVYVYRDETFGAAIKIPIVINGRIIGDTVSKSYFRIVMEPGNCEVQCKASSDSTQSVKVEAGKVYFLRQEMKMGMWAAGCMMHLMTEAEGRAAIAECKLIDAPETLPK
ncbi:MAG TPA: DUF2846 domain-containing protein [Geothrix sp.]|nr:DUF2846 domain-containing protein [Geothrix sp.]